MAPTGPHAVDYGTWLLDEQGHFHVAKLADLITPDSGTYENGQPFTNPFVKLAVMYPQEEVPNGAVNPKFEMEWDYLTLNGVRPATQQQTYSTISARVLVAQGIAPHEKFTDKEGTLHEVWRDGEKKGYMMVVYENGRKVVRTVSKAQQERIFSMDI
ncbi:hypothetical protein H2200_002454 [Cladophialophora chaetospira]|uniref:Uncharacterized protein n=1 Tax=Cladophialophora chaetospira TaxID=386627 RepID=A0AA39CNK8_9EURO|nr:hypothetical protein H2200_002454 [Cladophialophora chaetospira]